MKRFRYALAPVAAALIFGISGAAHADRYTLSFSSPGVLIGYGWGHGYHGHHGHKGHYGKRYHFKHHDRKHYYFKRHGYSQPRFRHGYRHGYYRYGYRHPRSFHHRRHRHGWWR